MIIGCSHGKHLAKKIAKHLKKPYSELYTKKFPDGETYLKFNVNLKNKVVILIQSFYGNVNDCLIETFFAAKTARDLGAKKIILVAPYFPYLRQDKEFRTGECVSIKSVADYIDSCIDEIFIIDPHLHRKNTLNDIFKIKSYKLSANRLIANYIITNLKNPILIGPDFESYKWAKESANFIGSESIILEKRRCSPRKVKISHDENLEIIKNRTVVIVDDIISTGNTLLETIKLLKKYAPKSITCIGVHGIFTENALKKIQKTRVKVVSCNSIPTKVSKIDLSVMITDELKKKIKLLN